MEKLKKAIQGKTRWDGLLHYISLVEENLISNPNASLDGAKSILESVSKTILADKNVEYRSDESIGNLVKQAFSSLPVFAKLSTIEAEKSRAILNAFATISNSIGIFRNEHGFFAHGQDLQSQKFDRYLLDLAISSSDLLASFLIISHAEDLKDRSRIYYEECSIFNIWFDENSDDIEISGIKISPSKALFDQDEIAYKEKYIEYTNNPQDLISSLEYVGDLNYYEQIISNFKKLNYKFNIEELEKLNNIAKEAMENVKPSLDMIKSLQIPQIDTSVLKQINYTIQSIQPNLDIIKSISNITMNKELIKNIKSINEILIKNNLHIKNIIMTNSKKVTTKKAASAASKTLRDRRTSKDSKSAAGSALSQTKAPQKTTNKKAASAASKTLTNKSTAKASKISAGSALSQTPSKKIKK